MPITPTRSPDFNAEEDDRVLYVAITDAFSERIATVGIRNDGTGDSTTGHYDVVLWPNPSDETTPVELGRILNYARSAGAWPLTVTAMMMAANYDNERGLIAQLESDT